MTATWEAPQLSLSDGQDAWTQDHSEAVPVVIVYTGAALLALLAAFGGAALACRWVCGAGNVISCNMSYFPAPSLSITCRT